MAIRHNIRYWMHRRGIKTPTELARRAGLVPLTLIRLIKGNTTGIEFKTLDVLCKALGCTPGDLFSYDPDYKERVYVHDAD